MALQYRSCEAPTVVGLLKAAHGGAFIGVNVKYGEQFGDLKQVVHSFSEVEQLQLPALACDRGIAAHQLADARAIDVVHFAQVQDNFLMTLAKIFADHLAQQGATLAEGGSEEHTSELQSRGHLVYRLLLDKKNRYRLNTLIHRLPDKQNYEHLYR